MARVNEITQFYLPPHDHPDLTP